MQKKRFSSKKEAEAERKKWQPQLEDWLARVLRLAANLHSDKKGQIQPRDGSAEILDKDKNKVEDEIKLDDWIKELKDLEAEGYTSLVQQGQFGRPLPHLSLRSDRWLDGVIPDLNEAVDSPRQLSDDAGQAERLLEVVPGVPLLVWGRDEMKAGEMWNSNSIISWMLARAGINAGEIEPPTGGRAPGWKAGIVAAGRQTLRTPRQPVTAGSRT